MAKKVVFKLVQQPGPALLCQILVELQMSAEQLPEWIKEQGHFNCSRSTLMLIANKFQDFTHPQLLVYATNLKTGQYDYSSALTYINNWPAQTIQQSNKLSISQAIKYSFSFSSRSKATITLHESNK